MVSHMPLYSIMLETVSKPSSKPAQHRHSKKSSSISAFNFRILLKVKVGIDSDDFRSNLTKNTNKSYLTKSSAIHLSQL